MSIGNGTTGDRSIRRRKDAGHYRPNRIIPSDRMNFYNRKTVPAAIIFLLILLLVSCILPIRTFDEQKWRAQVESADPALLYAPHLEDGRYFNPWMPMQTGFSDFLRWQLSEKTPYAPEEEKDVPAVLSDLPARIRATPGDFIAWIGHASFLIRINGEYWITDPIFSVRALLPKRKTPPGLSLDDFVALTGKKNVLISHSHYDHLDSESIRRLSPETRVYVPLGLKAMMNELGKQDVVEMDWWQAVSCGDRCQVVCLPAQHWSRRITQDTDTTLWASFLLVSSDRKIYYGGDSGYFIGYREIGRRYPGIDHALLPVTAYDPRWFMHYAHMDAREALDAFRDLGARYFIPTQWGTFRLGDEPIGQAPSALSKAAQSTKTDPARIIVMGIGQLLPIEIQEAKFKK
jgi:N-acyl-phosphatidylethanolamine-hydrolysing phospholipase D